MEGVSDSDCEPLHILIIGQPGSGKSSLAGALIKGRSTGVPGPDPATTEYIESTNVQLNESTYIMVHDTGGLDLYSNNDSRINVMQTILLNQKSVVVVCVRWDSCFIDSNRKKIFKIVNSLSSDVWRHTVIALTHSDNIPSEIKSLTPDRRNDAVAEINEKWNNQIKEELRGLGVSEDILGQLKICNTSHTEIASYPKQYWLPPLVEKICYIYPDLYYILLTHIVLSGKDEPRHSHHCRCVYKSVVAFAIGAGIGLCIGLIFGDIVSAVIGAIHSCSSSCYF